MSWQAYVDDHLLCEIEGNHLSAAAIIGHDGSVWAQSENFPQVFFSKYFFNFLTSFISKSIWKDGFFDGFGFILSYFCLWLVIVDLFFLGYFAPVGFSEIWSAWIIIDLLAVLGLVKLI